jgi:hypothetical protein
MAQDCARDAARYLHAPIGAVQPTGQAAETLPLVERLKLYAREAAIADSAGKVIELSKRDQLDAGDPEPTSTR